jgi:predicted DNA-binding protein with PD1-like motif
MKVHTFRILPGQDLRQEIERYAELHQIKSGFVITCVGGLSSVKLRMAGAMPDKQDIRSVDGDYEIVSLVGTIAAGDAHLHLAAANREGEIMGGHLKEGCYVYPTAEVVLGEDENVTYSREMDEQTGFEELKITPLASQ